CDDGLFCTDPDTCSQGVCTGPPRDCGEDVCDKDADECVPLPPAEEEGPQPVFLDPVEGELVYGDVVLWAGEANGRRDIESALFEYSPDGESWFLIATDLDGDETPAVCGFVYDDSASLPFGFERSPPVEGWNATWDTTGLSDGDYLVRVNLTDGESEVGTEMIELKLESTPPIPVIVRPSYEEAVNGTVNISIDILDEDVIWLNITLFPVPDYYEKGVTNKSQHNYGLGQGPNGTNIGDMYCGPTSAASCFDYWADNGYPAIKKYPNGSAMNQSEFVEALADLMNTTENGTYKSDFYRAVREWTRTHGDQFNVSEYRAPNFTVYQRELADKEEDVLVFMLWWGWNGTSWVRDGGHWVVGNSVNQTRNPAPRNDTHWVDLMNPWTGTVVQKRMRDDGWIEWTEGRLWGEVWNIVSVPPKEDTRPVIPLGTDLSGADGWGLDWDTTLFDNGYYFIDVRAMDSTGHSGEATTLVRVHNEISDPCEPADHVLISEVLYDSPNNEPYGEWVELYNPT
ncbi:MAG: hypothetical protein KAT35_01740, partial [Candidatus Aenigmarchaeota archaeon]|nr:hypothetical protein [Candidatus Aenigmarchaeota archaeon]